MVSYPALTDAAQRAYALISFRQIGSSRSLTQHVLRFLRWFE
jgi:hypothetical protein